MRILRTLLLCTLISCCGLPASTPAASGHDYLFYEGRTYGSESLIHPLRMILHGGYGILQLDNQDASPWDIDYENGVEVVGRSLFDPFGAIQEHGYWEFVKRELLPVSIDNDGGQYWPNYMNHLIGGGMSYRMMVDWFHYYGYQHPKLWSGGTVLAYHLLNEIVEARDVDRWSADPVADMWIFNPAGILLFSHDGVAGFFAHRLHMQDWSFQISYDAGQERWVNNGQNFSMKLDLPWSDTWRLFYHFGTHAELGMSYRLPNGDELSVGAGLVAKNLIPSDGNFRTVDLARTAGIWWDRDGSLLASLDWANDKAYRLRTNVYPGVVGIGAVRPGLFGILHRDGDVTLGFAFRWMPVGLGGRR